jgi:hypothetical protein
MLFPECSKFRDGSGSDCVLWLQVCWVRWDLALGKGVGVLNLWQGHHHDTFQSHHVFSYTLVSGPRLFLCSQCILPGTPIWPSNGFGAQC